MAKLTKCVTCGHTVSSRAKLCPGCGHGAPAAFKVARSLLVMMTVGGIAYYGGVAKPHLSSDIHKVSNQLSAMAIHATDTMSRLTAP